MLAALIPEVFYADMGDGLDLFVAWGPREVALLDATTVCVIFRDGT